MFTNNKAKYYRDDKILIDSACLSTDTKPTTGVANGSKCIEMDTGKTYMFNEEDSEWEELPSSGGGGGGSSDFSTKTVTIINGDTDTIDVPLMPCIDELTVYERVAPNFIEKTLGETLHTTGTGADGLEPSESKSFNILVYKEKILLEGLLSGYDVINTTGCIVEEYYPAPEDGQRLALITFTSDSASITVEYAK